MCVGGEGKSGEGRGDDGAVLDEEFGDGEGVGGFLVIGGVVVVIVVLVVEVVSGAGRGRGGGGRGSGVGGSEGEEDGVGVSGAVVSVWIGAEGEGVENALDVIFLDGSEEGFIRGGVVGLRVGADGGDVCSLNIFVCNKAEALVAGCVCGGFDAFFHVGFPDHVTDAVADLEEDFDDVGAEGGGVEG